MHSHAGPWEREDVVLVEAFRRADLVDLSLGTIGSGLPGDFTRAVQK